MGRRLTLDRRLSEAHAPADAEAGRTSARSPRHVRGLREQIALLIGLDRFDRCRRPEPVERAAVRRRSTARPSRRPGLAEGLRSFSSTSNCGDGSGSAPGRLGSEACSGAARIVNRSELNANAQVARHAAHFDAGSAARSVPRLRAQVHGLRAVPLPAKSEADRRALEQLLRTESPAHTKASARLRRAAVSHRRAIDDRLRRRRRRGARGRAARRGAARRRHDADREDGPAAFASLGRARIGTTDYCNRLTGQRTGDAACHTTITITTSTRGMCPACAYGPFVRNAYWTGKLMLARDFTDEQRYADRSAAPPQPASARLGRGLRAEGRAAREARMPRALRLRAAGVGDRLLRPRSAAARDRLRRSLGDPGHQGAQGRARTRRRTCCRSASATASARPRRCPVLYDECGCDEDRLAPNRILESYELEIQLLDKNPADPPPPFPRTAATCGRRRSTSVRTATPRTASCSRRSRTTSSATRSWTAMPSPVPPEGAAVIDNVTYRHLLPSVETIKEFLDCLKLCAPGAGGGTGPQGRPG